MKGALHTDVLMHAVVAGDHNLRTERRVSHVYVMDVPSYPRPLLITDAAINIYPNLEVKRDTIELAHALGNEPPKVARAHHLWLGLARPGQRRSSGLIPINADEEEKVASWSPSRGAFAFH